MRKLIGAMALAAATLVSVPASAATFIYDVDLGSDSIAFGKSNGWYKGFTDHFLFNLTEAGYVSAFVGSIALKPSLDVLLKSVLFDDKPITKVSTGNLELWTLGETPVGPGRHTIKVSGYYGQKGGSYAGNFNFSTVSAVPEPAAWAMMITGFGFVGYSMRRRTKVKLSYS